MQCGDGKLILSNDDSYVGEWKDALPHGKGTLTFGNGDRFQGGFERAVITGEGELNCKVSSCAVVSV